MDEDLKIEHSKFGKGFMITTIRKKWRTWEIFKQTRLPCSDWLDNIYVEF